MNIIDRRLNPGGKSLPNRQRFMNRARDRIRAAVAESLAKRKLSDIGGKDQEIRIDTRDMSEPTFRHGKDGDRDHVLPGNKKFVAGDTIERPQTGSGKPKASDQGGGEDGYSFILTRDEFLSIFFEDLELPDLVRRQMKDMTRPLPKRSGTSTSGSPTALDLSRSMRRAMGRRIALGRPDRAMLARLAREVELAVESRDDDRLASARTALDEALRKSARVPWMDPVDMRYKRFSPQAQPNTAAVMFCLMDVSGSMSQTYKDLAKRFFLLLSLFLERNYARVEIVFIRHTEVAEEVTEEVFFNDPRTGGTVVSTALSMMSRIRTERYPSSSWNVYVAQASDGDNFDTDAGAVTRLMSDDILPHVQHFAYIETRRPSDVERASDLWKMYQGLESVPGGSRLAMKRVTEPRDIWTVFSELFAKTRTAA